MIGFYVFFMMLLLIIIIITLFHNIFSPKYIDSESLDDFPTIHSKCNINSCGGNLICDNFRCKQGQNGNCSSDTDCVSGLICQNWKCVPKDESSKNEFSDDPFLKNKSSKDEFSEDPFLKDDYPNKKKSLRKSVRWDNKIEI
jgi:hypothetical protein